MFSSYMTFFYFYNNNPNYFMEDGYSNLLLIISQSIKKVIKFKVPRLKLKFP